MPGHVVSMDPTRGFSGLGGGTYDPMAFLFVPMIGDKAECEITYPSGGCSQYKCPPWQNGCGRVRRRAPRGCQVPDPEGNGGDEGGPARKAQGGLDRPLRRHVQVRRKLSYARVPVWTRGVRDEMRSSGPASQPLDVGHPGLLLLLERPVPDRVRAECGRIDVLVVLSHQGAPDGDDSASGPSSAEDGAVRPPVEVGRGRHGRSRAGAVVSQVGVRDGVDIRGEAVCGPR
jgi:hypothetical protein